jgi:hypothetical protein
MLISRGAQPTYLGVNYSNRLIEDRIKMADFNMCNYLITTFQIIPNIYTHLLEGEEYMEEYRMGSYSKDKLLDFLYNIIGLLINSSNFNINNIYNDNGDIIEVNRNGIGNSALHIAVEDRNECLIQALVKLGINKGIQDQNGQTALFIASSSQPEFSGDILSMLMV